MSPLFILGINDMSYIGKLLWKRIFVFCESNLRLLLLLRLQLLFMRMRKQNILTYSLDALVFLLQKCLHLSNTKIQYIGNNGHLVILCTRHAITIVCGSMTVLLEYIGLWCVLGYKNYR